MSKLNSAFVVIHIHTELITHIKITPMSGILEPKVLFIGKVIVTTWSGLEMSAYQQIWVHWQLQIFARAGMGVQKGSGV